MLYHNIGQCGVVVVAVTTCVGCMLAASPRQTLCWTSLKDIHTTINEKSVEIVARTQKKKKQRNLMVWTYDGWKKTLEKRCRRDIGGLKLRLQGKY